MGTKDLEQPVEQHPRLGAAVRAHDAHAQAHSSLAGRERPAIAARCHAVAEPEHRLVAVIARRPKLDLHANGAAVVAGPQAGLTSKKAGVPAGIDDDPGVDVVPATKRVARTDADDLRAVATQPFDG